MYKSIEPSKPPIKITNKIGHYFRFLLLPLGGSTISPWMCDFLKRKARKALKMTVTYFSVLYLISILYYVWLHLFPRKMRIRVEIERIRTQPKNYLTKTPIQIRDDKITSHMVFNFFFKIKIKFLGFFYRIRPSGKKQIRIQAKSKVGSVSFLPEDRWYHPGSTRG